MEAALESGLRVCVDLSFDAEMSDKEVRSCAKQVELSSVVNKRAVRARLCEQAHLWHAARERCLRR